MTDQSQQKPAWAKRQVDPVDKHVGSKIFAARIELGLSMNELGNKIGVTFQQVQKYERGYNRVSVGRLMQISQVLGKSIHWFLPDADESAADVKRFTVFRSRQWLRLQELPSEFRTRILDLIDALWDAQPVPQSPEKPRATEMDHG